jgi:hypothetical protein
VAWVAWVSHVSLHLKIIVTIQNHLDIVSLIVFRSIQHYVIMNGRRTAQRPLCAVQDSDMMIQEYEILLVTSVYGSFWWHCPCVLPFICQHRCSRAEFNFLSLIVLLQPKRHKGLSHPRVKMGIGSLNKQTDHLTSLPHKWTIHFSQGRGGDRLQQSDHHLRQNQDLDIWYPRHGIDSSTWHYRGGAKVMFLDEVHVVRW